MKISWNWLCEFLPTLKAEGSGAIGRAADLLTARGFEIEGITERGGGLSGAVTAEVVAPARPHPNADKLRIVRVRAGALEEDVVCGAPNVPPPGHRVVWACPGTKLPSGLTIAAREVRGIMSPGMLCSEPELGLGDEAAGILILGQDVPAGLDFATHFGVHDFALEVNVTPNRADALSHLGLARELAAARGESLVMPSPPQTRRDGAASTPDVVLESDAGCPRYRGQVVSGVTLGPTPLAMRLRLELCGIRSISNLVDVTNYILLEFGQPLHAFDRDKLQGAVRVRRARPGERLATLDGQERALVPGDIVIADDSGPVALAGVMGGASTELTASTRTLFLEAATFESTSIRRTSKRLGLASESSYRYERGVDAAGIEAAASRAAGLLATLGGGAVGTAVVDRYPTPPATRTVSLSASRFARVSGDVLRDADLANLKAIGLDSTRSGDVLSVVVPSFRPDISLAEDLVEEVLRLSGRYQSVADPARVLPTSTPRVHPEILSERARDRLSALGLSEIAGWGFVPRTRLLALAGAEPTSPLANGVTVKNPISADYEVMRTSLIPGLVEVAVRNVARGAADVSLFEVGPVIHKGADPSVNETGFAQSEMAAGIIVGRAAGWLRPGEALDFFDLKTIVDELLSGLGAAGLTYGAQQGLAYLHPGISAEIRDGRGVLLGHLGQLHPSVGKKMGLAETALVFELALGALDTVRAAIRTITPPRVPAATRDISFWIDEPVTAADQEKALLGCGEPLLESARLLEDFRDPKYAPEGKKGMLWTLTYRAEDRTLTDSETDAAHDRALKALLAAFPIQIR